MLCLGIETSCDETALALVRNGQTVASVLATQMDVHALFGGIVPELASREHYRYIGVLYDELMRRSGMLPSDVEVIAVTRGPGLLGALLVGVAFGKGLALACDRPLVAVNHLHAHLLAAGVEHELHFPLLGLLVSGGHTHIYRIDAPDRLLLLGRTLDDAAGEACDKFAKMLGLPYPGGLLLDRMAQLGQADAGMFPRPYVHVDSLDFSFSGLKTAALLYVQEHPNLLKAGKYVRDTGTDAAPQELCNVCASYMLAVADTLTLKMRKALHQKTGQGTNGIIVAGGVAANTQVRAAMQQLAAEVGIPLLLPSPQLCTDNGVMIAYTGELLAERGLGHDLSFSAVPRGQHLPDDCCLLKHPLG